MALGPTSNALSELSRKRSYPEQIAELSERYRNTALRCLEADKYLWQQNVTTFQALIVIIYSINHSHSNLDSTEHKISRRSYFEVSHRPE
jgi:hypothetical protein